MSRTTTKPKSKSKTMGRVIGVRVPDNLWRKLEEAVRIKNAKGLLLKRASMSDVVREIIVNELLNPTQ